MTENERTERLLAETAWLQTLTRSLVADRDVADDVAQETLLVAWRRRLSGVVEIRPWLAAVARNLAKRMARSEGRRRRHEAQLSPRGEAPATDEVVARAAMQRDVVDATLALAEPYRTTLLLRFLEELSYGEIAQRLAVPVETVRTRIKRGLKQLRLVLDERHGEAKAWAVPILGVTGYQSALATTASAAAAGAVGAKAAVAGAGVLWMSLQAKVVVSAVVMVSALAAWQAWPQAEAQLPHQRADATAPLAAAGADATAPRDDDAATFAAELQRLLMPVPPEGTSDPAAAPFPGGGRVTVIGRVVDEATGQPLPGARVSLPPTGVTFTPHGSSEPLPETPVVVTADTAGRFTLPGDKAWNELEIVAEGHAVAYLPLLEAMARARLARSDTVDLGDILVPIGTQLRGRVLAADGVTLVPGARLAICRFGASVRVDVLGETGGDGSFALSRPLAPGKDRAFLVADRGANGRLPSGIGWRELDVSRRASVQSGFDVTLLPTADVVARVVDDLGRPIADASLTMWAPNFVTGGDGAPRVVVGGVPDWNSWRYGEARTDRFGVATVAGRPVAPDQIWAGRRLAGGAYVVSLRAEGHRGDYRDIQVRPGRNELDFVLSRDPEATVRGFVVEQGSGQPIADATIAILGAGGEWSARSDAQGVFACEQIDLSKGVLTVTVGAEGHMSRRIVESVAGRSGDLELRIELAPAVPVAGAVVDQDGAPIADVAIWLGDQHRMSAADGSFMFDAVPKDLLTLRVVPSPQLGTVQTPLVAQQIDTREHLEPLRIVLQRRAATGAGTEVEFTICESAAGRALEPSMVALAPVDAKDRITGVMLPLQPFVGGARGSDIPPGRYQLRIETREGPRGVRTVEIPSGVLRYTERIELDAPGSVAVTVDLSAVPPVQRPTQLQVELSPWDAGHFGARNKKDVGDQRLFWFCLDLARGSDLDVEGVAPGTPCKLTVRDERFAGEVGFTAEAGQRTTATLRVLPK